LNTRNALSLFNLGEGSAHALFWDGRVSREPGTGILNVPDPNLTGASIDPVWRPYTEQLRSPLAAQAMFPVTLTVEMRGSGNELAAAPDNRAVWEALMLRLGAIPAYVEFFTSAYPTAPSFEALNFAHAARAIAAFERAAYTQLDTPLDRYLGGDAHALSESAKRGAVIFCERAGCAACHGGEHLTDWAAHAIAAPQVGPGRDAPFEDRGRFLVTSRPEDLYAFRTPPLRNVARTGPWTHAGAYTSLEAVVRHHLDPAGALLGYDPTQLPAAFQPSVDTDPDRNAARLAAVSPKLRAPLALSDEEVEDLLAFLHALTSPSAAALVADVPEAVPSGLPVAD
jgi:cytochrome c peroxidase